jgi:hypothetical protein
MKTEQKIVDMPTVKSAVLDRMDANLKAIHAAAKRMGVTA